MRLSGVYEFIERTRWVFPLLVGSVAVAAFFPAVQNGFVDYDDVKNIVANPDYRGLGSAQLGWMFTTFHMGPYMPLTWMTFGLDYLLWGMSPGGYHLTNLILHAANAVTFYFVALRLLRTAMHRRIGWEALGLRFGAAFTALLFAVHPLRVESVAWVTERRDVLSGLFFLLAILAYLRFCEPSEGQRVPRRRWYWASLGFFTLALLSKSIAVSLPVILLLLDVYPLGRLGGPRGDWLGPVARTVWVEKIPFILLGAATSLIAFLGQFYGGTMASLGVLAMADRVAVSVYGLAFYLWKTVVPLQLSPMYELKLPVKPLAWSFLLSGAVVLGISGLAIALRRRWAAFGVVWVSYIVILLPVMGLFQSGRQIAADRYSYLACLGWAVLTGGGFAWAWRYGITRARLLAVIAVATAVILTLAGLTWQQVQVWRNSVSLWTHAVSVDPSSPVVANNLMVALLAEGRVAEAHAHFKRTIQDVRGRKRVRWFFTMAMALQESGELDAAARYYREVISLDPNHEEAWNNLGVIYATRGEFSQALAAYLRALEINPGYNAACENGRRAATLVGTTHAVLEHCGKQAK